MQPIDSATSQPNARYPKHGDGAIYAYLNHPRIDAVVNQLFRFATEAQAVAHINAMKDMFILSKHQAPNTDYPSAIFWIKGFAVTLEEEKQGLIGNYAMITHGRLEDGHFTLVATKLPSQRRFHPMKRQLKANMPNWAHPILRQIKKRSSLCQYGRCAERYPKITRAISRCGDSMQRQSLCDDLSEAKNIASPSCRNDRKTAESSQAHTKICIGFTHCR